MQPEQARRDAQPLGLCPGPLSDPGFGDTVDFDQIKAHYYEVHEDINPTQIVPKGPEMSSWLSDHGRENLGGAPFAEGASAPGPVAPEEQPPGANPLHS